MCGRQAGLKEELVYLSGYNNEEFDIWLSNEDQDIESFKGLIAMLNVLYPGREKAAMDSYSQDLNPDCKTARHMLEYALLNKLPHMSERIRKQLGASEDRQSKLWAKYYTIDYQAAKGEITLQEAIDLSMSDGQYQEAELRVYSRLVQIYSYYDMKNYPMIHALSDMVQADIKLIKDEYIRECYTARLALVLAGIGVVDNNIEMARVNAKKIIIETDCDNFKAMAYSYIASTYIFTNFNEAKKNYNFSLNYCNLNNDNYTKKLVLESLNFLYSYWKKETQYELEGDSVTVIHDRAFQLIVSGNYDEALEVLNSVHLEDKSECEKGFHFYYKGLITDSKDDFYESVYHFKKVGEKFYINCPLIELSKLETNVTLLKALSA